MTAGRISSKDEFSNVKTKLLFGLCDDPHIGLVAVVHWARIGTLRRKSIVNTKDRHSQLNGPLACVVLMSARVLAAEATPMEMNDSIVVLLDVLSIESPIVENADLNLRLRRMVMTVSVINYISVKVKSLPSVGIKLTKTLICHSII